MRKVNIYGSLAILSLTLVGCGPSAADLAAIETERNAAKAHNEFHDLCASVKVLTPDALLGMDWDATGGKIFIAEGFDPSVGQDLVTLIEGDLTTLRQDFLDAERAIAEATREILAGVDVDLDPLRDLVEGFDQRSKVLHEELGDQCQPFASKRELPELPE